MTRPLALIQALDDMYRRVVEDPSTSEQELTGLLQDAAVDLDDKILARFARRGLRRAVKLGRFWSEPGRTRPDDWQNAVDEALGSTGWEPTLEIARRGLELDPSPELYAELGRRFPLVHFQPWHGGSYEEWLATS